LMIVEDDFPLFVSHRECNLFNFRKFKVIDY